MIGTTAQRRGFTVIEVIMALAIGAILMAAVGAAMFAGAHSMKANDDFSQVTQTARAAVQTVSTAARTSHTCNVGDNVGGIVGDAGLPPIAKALTSAVLYVTPFNSTGGAGPRVAYVYDSTNKMLLVDTTPADPPTDDAWMAGVRSRMGGSSPTVFSLGNRIESASFVGIYDQRKYNPLLDAEVRLVNVQIKLQAKAGESVLDLSDSVVPRTSYDQ